MGLVFTQKNLIALIYHYKSFKNSFMMAYDSNKSQFGMNPVKCYRLSQKAIDTLNLNDLLKVTDQLVQDKIKEHNLTIETFFEECPVKIHRSHLLQAFLFDHIQPKIPSFNTSVLKMGGSDQYMTQHLI